ncbi:MAG: hypothetical protein KDI82_04805 [Gammaproteobacteria bacterium]|nr:hypothetical protein [Gammaproteobacteria bacterium]
MIPAFEDPDLKRDIERLEEKREVLQQVIEIAKAIENMQDSLDSVLVLGVPSKDMPECAMATYDSISENLKSLPVAKLKEYLENLERIVRNQLGRILGYAGVDFDSEEGIEILTIAEEGSTQSPLDLLEDFRRTAQTTVSLRVLLRKRGVPTPGAQLPVPKDVIEQQLGALHEHEQKQRARIGDKIGEMRADLATMIANPAYPDAIKQALRDADAALRADADALTRGEPLNSLGFIAEAEEIVVMEAAAPVAEEPEEIVIADVPAQAAVPTAQKRGFKEKAGAWLNSSWDVSWDDLDQK